MWGTVGLIQIRIDGRDIQLKRGKTLLAGGLEAGIYIPHLCDHADLSPSGKCGLCVVEIEGVEGTLTSCTTPVVSGMVVKTKSEKLQALRRLAMATMLGIHPPDCGTCIKYSNCEFQSLKQFFAIDQLVIPRRARSFAVDHSNPLFVHDPNKCIVCGRCLTACKDLRGVGILTYKIRNEDTYVSTSSGLSLVESGCRFCGACAEVCPTGAILDKAEFTAGKTRKAALVPCRYSCPAEIDVPAYIRFIREGKYSAAVAVIREKVPFPTVLGYVCDHPCERACRRGEVNQPIAIRNLKRYAAERDTEEIWKKNSRRKPSTGQRVAIVGSGPAGLTAAYYLCNQGHDVTVFEALPKAGGMMRYGIPKYRLPRGVLDREIHDIEDSGVEIRNNTRVESIESLHKEGYNAVLLALGTHKGQRLPIPGAAHPDVLVGVDFLRELNLGNKVAIGRSVVVVGGGNTAFDCARSARRIGAEHVHVACLESRTEMLAARDEIDQGIEEGLLIHPSKSFIQIITANGKISGVECMDVASFSLDEDKRLRIDVVERSNHVIDADMVIFAIGQQADIPKGFGLNGAVTIPTQADLCTVAAEKDGLFAAGDAVSGAGSVIKAIASGRKCAIAIDRYLGGQGRIDEKLAPEQRPNPRLGTIEGFAYLCRSEDPCVPAEERVQSFCRVVEDMGEESAAHEASRCLQCDLRIGITPVKFWSEY
jgi:formate dehydrogenase (NADP+) beta subunit